MCSMVKCMRAHNAAFMAASMRYAGAHACMWVGVHPAPHHPQHIRHLLLHQGYELTVVTVLVPVVPGGAETSG